MRRDSFTASTDAQSCVIGVLLIFGIVFSATTMYLAINAPIETKKCEFQHAAEVADDFTVLRSSIAQLSRAESSVASTSVPIKMAPTKESMITLPLSSGSIRFSQTAEEIITVRVNEPGTGASGTWTDDDFNGTMDDNVKVTAGNVTLSGPPYPPYPLYGYIESTINDTGRNSTCYGIISWHEQTTPDVTKIIMKVRTSMFPDMENATDWYAYSNGTNISSVSPTLNGHRYVQFRAELKTWDPSETPTLMNVSINHSPFDGILTNSSGVITFASNYKYLPNHVLTYEHGAVIKSQEAGGLVIGNFNISFSNASGVPRINISLVNLTGTDVSAYSGATSTSVRLFRGDYKLISDCFYYPNVTINISTEYPSVWGNWFNKTLEEESGLGESYYNVTVNTTAKTVLVEFYGHGDGIQLYLEKTTVAVEV